jgi:hypothetical protein
VTPVPSVPRPQSAEEREACADAFLADIREMCALIAEADRYGATSGMEESYRALRSRLALAYQALSRDVEFPHAGFHGCGFEMILGPHTLEGLVRNSGVRAIERLSEVWRSVCPAV